MSAAEKVLAVIGGGRWGMVTLSVLAKMQLPFTRVVVVSQYNSTAVQLEINELALHASIKFEVISTLDEALAKYNIQAAVVVNAAQQHFKTAQQLIRNGIHVLIEKPVVQSLSDMHMLIIEAVQHNVCMVPGLSYRFCAYLKNFSNEVFARGVPIKFSFKWVDSANEVRYGHVKNYDSSISVVQDVMPHVWTILSVVFRSPLMKVDDFLSHDKAGNKAIMNASIKDIHGEILLERNGSNRQRILAVQLDTDSLMLDFSIEPGVIYADEKKFSADPSWAQSPSPLMRQLEYFFSVIATARPLDEDLKCCLDSVVCTERTEELLERMSESYV